jgi:predicted MPP superfamily phosphohydrolase
MKLPAPLSMEVKVDHKDLDGLAILHLSDLHINTKISTDSLHSLVKQCNSLSYDFIVLTGDIIDTQVIKIIDKLKILNTLSGKVYYISGNHDIFYGLKALKKELSNFIFLDNRSAQIDFHEKQIYLLGLADRFSKFFHIQRDVEKVLQLSKNKSPIIFLSHQPKDYKIALEANASLFLCGHTHGGQIFPFHYLVRLVQPYLSGLYYKKTMAIYVNSGLGTWGIHHRYKAPSEITLLKLQEFSVD